MRTTTKTVIACGIVALLSGALSGYVATAMSGAQSLKAGQSLSGCLDPQEGSLVLSGAAQDCGAGLVAVAWQSAEAPNTGPAGPAGQTGQAGMTGAVGPSGTPGEPGEPGEAGAPGAAGQDGAPGEAGAPGAQGERGQAGERGETGEPGRDGEAGAPGEPGRNGEKGDTGERGDKGDAGEAGQRGETGQSGEKGEKGDAGEKGETGQKGDAGETGEKGEKGEKGETGVSAWATVSAWDAGSTYSAGPPASIVTHEGSTYVAARSSVGAVPSQSASDWIRVAAAGVRGEKGDRGDKGDPGAQGDAGQKGEAGEKGDTGEKGEKGATGEPGLPGAAGRDAVAPWSFWGDYDAAALYTGVAPASVVQFAGSTWVAVAQNAFTGIEPGTDPQVWSLVAAAGAQGEQGVQGVQGIQGVQGEPGERGAVGPVGPTGPQGEPANSLLSEQFGSNSGQGWTSGGGRECFIGEIILSASKRGQDFPAKGQILSVNQYAALYSLLGNTYGGDGITTFALPDLTAVAPNNMTYYVCTYGIFPSMN